MKFKLNALLTIALIFSGLILFYNYKVTRLQKELVDARFANDSVIVLLDSSVAMRSREYINSKALSDALTAEKELNGQLMAAARIRLQPRPVIRDTVYTPTEITQAFFRRMNVVDTTEAGILDARIVAPPHPQDLLFSYSYTPAPINATVSVVQMKDNSAVFVVNYRGGSSTIEAPFARLPKKEKILVPYAEALYSPIPHNNAAVRFGAQLKLPFLEGIYGIGEAQQLFGETNFGTAYIGLRKVF